MSNTPDSANNPRSEMLGNAPVTSLMIKFAVPSIIAMLVGALYNIVDQLFIGQAVGQLGNAATNIAFPFSTSCLSLALLFGIGGASCFNLSMGRGDRERAPYFVGNAVKKGWQTKRNHEFPFSTILILFKTLSICLFDTSFLIFHTSPTVQ